ncbi:hypothetical protein FQA47_003034 [Oryzias melastigma]|uniref:Uncharacterized protein n=1 Tax=Oryzias melastigma TaxID=30732 RepID=A0A834CF80_ORYME|nr:hypothetical protein FQA47_003034 [Oryzias melastigma]
MRGSCLLLHRLRSAGSVCAGRDCAAFDHQVSEAEERSAAVTLSRARSRAPVRSASRAAAAEDDKHNRKTRFLPTFQNKCLLQTRFLVSAVF